MSFRFYPRTLKSFIPRDGIPNRASALVLPVIIALILAIHPFGDTTLADDIDESVDSNPDVVLDVVRLKKSDVDESSGLAVSNVRADRWWTHNDSGDKAQLYAISKSGKQTGRCELKDIQADDWEDMASFVQDDTPRLIVADTGDNLNKRKSVTLYLFDEPNPDQKTTVDHVQSLEVTFPDRAHDCEAVAVDASRKKIILVTKAKLPHALVFDVDLPDRPIRSVSQTIHSLARRVTSLPLPMISAMDIDPVNGDVWIVNYFQAFHFKRSQADQPLADQLAALPLPITLPHWRQIEAVAVDRDHHVWITSEGKSPPLGRLKSQAATR